MKNLGQFFQEGNGQYSATRLAFIAWVFGALAIWGACSFNNKKMQEIPSSVQILVGVLMMGKVAQKISEGTGTTAPTDQAAIKNDQLVNPSLTGNGTALALGKLTESR